MIFFFRMLLPMSNHFLLTLRTPPNSVFEMRSSILPTTAFGKMGRGLSVVFGDIVGGGDDGSIEVQEKGSLCKVCVMRV